MAENILKHFHGRQIYVDPVGVRAGEIDGFAVEILDEIGIDLSRHRSKSFDDLEDEFYDLIITLSPEAQHRAVELTRTMAVAIEFWNTFDPSIVEGNRDTRIKSIGECGTSHLNAYARGSLCLRRLIRNISEMSYSQLKLLNMPDLILASASPRRRELLAQIGIVPDVIEAADLQETVLSSELPRVHAARLAEEKSKSGRHSIRTLGYWERTLLLLAAAGSCRKPRMRRPRRLVWR